MTFGLCPATSATICRLLGQLCGRRLCALCRLDCPLPWRRPRRKRLSRRRGRLRCSGMARGSGRLLRYQLYSTESSQPAWLAGLSWFRSGSIETRRNGLMWVDACRRAVRGCGGSVREDRRLVLRKRYCGGRVIGSRFAVVRRRWRIQGHNRYKDRQRRSRSGQGQRAGTTSLSDRGNLRNMYKRNLPA